jgi:hypothetical protein
MKKYAFVCLFLLITAYAFTQQPSTQGGDLPRGSIPEELLRPRRGEAPRYPVDTVIGSLGRGDASEEAYSFAVSVAEGFLSGLPEHAGLRTVNAGLRENYLNILDNIELARFRLGGGREEPDGSVSFLIRFMGKDKNITGELFVRYVTRHIEETVTKEVAVTAEDNDNDENTIQAEIAIEDNENVENEKKVDVVEEVVTRTVSRWAFDDLILEDPKNREEEQRSQQNGGQVQRFDFSPYERFF